MSEVVVDTNTLEDIGNAIRAQNGGQELYRPSEMAAAIRSLSNVEVDPTLTVSGAAADARVVGQKFDEDEAAIRRIRGDLEETADNLDAVSGYQVKNVFRPEWEERTHNGITWTINNDLTVTIRGQASANEYQSSTFPVKAGTYVLTGCPDGGSEVGYHMLYHDPVTDNAIYETGEGRIITFPEDVEEFQVYIRAKTGTSVANGVTFSPMLRPVEIEDGTYMQYGLIYVEESLAEVHESLGDVIVDVQRLTRPNIRNAKAIFADGVPGITIDVKYPPCENPATDVVVRLSALGQETVMRFSDAEEIGGRVWRYRNMMNLTMIAIPFTFTATMGDRVSTLTCSFIGLLNEIIRDSAPGSPESCRAIAIIDFAYYCAEQYGYSPEGADHFLPYTVYTADDIARAKTEVASYSLQRTSALNNIDIRITLEIPLHNWYIKTKVYIYLAEGDTITSPPDIPIVQTSTGNAYLITHNVPYDKLCEEITDDLTFSISGSQQTAKLQYYPVTYVQRTIGAGYGDFLDKFMLSIWRLACAFQRDDGLASREYVNGAILNVANTVMGLTQGIPANTQWNVMQNVGASIPYEIIIPDGYKPIMTFISFVYSSYGTCIGRSASINKSAGKWYLMGTIRNYGIQDDVVSGFDVKAICVREA